MPTAPRILVFDSGVGGLTIAQSILEQHPYCKIVYASDNAAFPYGTKAEPELITRVDKVLNHIQQAFPIDIIVIACNTASTVALPVIRKRFTQPIIGVVPAIKPAALLSKSKVIGLLATPGTIERQYTHDLIREFAHDCTVHSIGSSELVLLAEEQLRNQAAMSPSLQTDSQAQLTQILQPFIQQQEMDTVVLACTHFPLLANQLKSVMPRITHWVDSGEAIARRVGYWIEQLAFDLSSMKSQSTEHSSVFTSRNDSITALFPVLKERDMGDIHFLAIEKSNASSTL